jgi:flagellar hook protein FlgE
MGILGALSTSVSGLAAQSYALENISGNIANASTVGFKRVDTSFVDLIPDQPAHQELAGSVSGRSQLTNTLQGTLSTTGVNTNLAISGSGFFVVAQNNGSAQTPAFSNTSLYTRRGDFQKDANGYLVNGSGYYLSGTTIDPATGTNVGTQNSPIKIPNTPIPAKATTSVSFSGNLPLTPQTQAYVSSTPDSDLLAAASFTAGTTGPSTVDETQEDAFLKQTISGGQITVYDAAGNPANLQLRWGKTAEATATTPSTWQLFYQTDATATGTDPRWTTDADNTVFSFNQSGQSVPTGTATTVPSALNFTGMTINGSTIGDVTVNLPASGLTQYSDSNGVVTASIDQNGYTSGTPQVISISSDGSILQSYSNGQTKVVGQVGLAQFSAADSLKRENGGAYSATVESGDPTFGLDGSTLTGGSVEASNTDISSEFSKMIVTQQAYSANTKVMSTAQSMLQDIINLIR